MKSRSMPGLHSRKLVRLDTHDDVNIVGNYKIVTTYRLWVCFLSLILPRYMYLRERGIPA